MRKAERTRAYYRWQRRRWIKKRTRLFRSLWSGAGEMVKRNRGRFSKWNGVCSCNVCRDEKYARNEVKRRTAREILDELVDLEFDTSYLQFS